MQPMVLYEATLTAGCQGHFFIATVFMLRWPPASPWALAGHGAFPVQFSATPPIEDNFAQLHVIPRLTQSSLWLELLPQHAQHGADGEHKDEAGHYEQWHRKHTGKPVPLVREPSEHPQGGQRGAARARKPLVGRCYFSIGDWWDSLGTLGSLPLLLRRIRSCFCYGRSHVCCGRCPVQMHSRRRQGRVHVHATGLAPG